MKTKLLSILFMLLFACAVWGDNKRNLRRPTPIQPPVANQQAQVVVRLHNYGPRPAYRRDVFAQQYFGFVYWQRQVVYNQYLWRLWNFGY